MRLTSIESSFHPYGIYRKTGEGNDRRDSHEVAKLYLRLIAETDVLSVGDSHPSCSFWFLLRL